MTGPDAATALVLAGSLPGSLAASLAESLAASFVASFLAASVTLPLLASAEVVMFGGVGGAGAAALPFAASALAASAVFAAAAFSRTIGFVWPGAAVPVSNQHPATISP